MRHAPDHCAHGRQAFALDDLLFQLSLHRNIADRHDHAAGLAFRIEQGAGVGPHSAPASVAVTRPELAEAEFLGSRAHVVVEGGKFGGLLLLGAMTGLALSPALDAGDPGAPGTGTACEAVDQRGVGRRALIAGGAGALNSTFWSGVER